MLGDEGDGALDVVEGRDDQLQRGRQVPHPAKEGGGGVAISRGSHMAVGGQRDTLRVVSSAPFR